MSISRDVKALFDRFGGDATRYREIRMENEARDARGRWPLLGMTDPREVALPSSDASRASPLADPSTLEGGEAGGGRVHAPRDRSQAALRNSAPLFTRSPRRDVPAVFETKKPATPESSAFRFSPLPVEGVAGQGIVGTQGEAGTDDKACSVDNDNALAGPAPKSAQQPAERLSPQPVQQPALQPTQAVSAPPGFSGAPRLSNTAPLKKLVGAAVATPQAGRAQPAPAGSEPVRLDTLFERLRMGGENPEAAGKLKAEERVRPWFLGGVGQR
jgi:resuscitation-promoting factor RpfA